MKNDEDLGLEETHRWETGGVLRRLDFILREWQLPRKLNRWSDSLCLTCFPGSDREGEEGGREDAGAGICSLAGVGGGVGITEEAGGHKVSWGERGSKVQSRRSLVGGGEGGSLERGFAGEVWVAQAAQQLALGCLSA